MIDPALARSIRSSRFDVDGVMTDGGIYLGDVDGQPARVQALRDPGRARHRTCCGAPAFRSRSSPAASPRASGCARASSASTTSRRIPTAHKLAGFLEHSRTARHRAVGGGVRRRRLSRPGRCCDSSASRSPSATPCPKCAPSCSHQLTRHGGRGAVREFAEDVPQGARRVGDVAWNRYVAERSLTSDVGRARDTRRDRRARPARRAARARGARRRSRSASATSSRAPCGSSPTRRGGSSSPASASPG